MSENEGKIGQGEDEIWLQRLNILFIWKAGVPCVKWPPGTDVVLQGAGELSAGKGWWRGDGGRAEHGHSLSWSEHFASLRVRYPPWAKEDGEPDLTWIWTQVFEHDPIRRQGKCRKRVPSAGHKTQCICHSRGLWPAPAELDWLFCWSKPAPGSFPAPQTPLINDGGWLHRTLCALKLPLILVH